MFAQKPLGVDAKQGNGNPQNTYRLWSNSYETFQYTVLLRSQGLACNDANSMSI